jgi:hypothetical protein
MIRDVVNSIRPVRQDIVTEAETAPAPHSGDAVVRALPETGEQESDVGSGRVNTAVA